MPAVRTLDERCADGRCVRPASAVQNVTVSKGEEYGTEEIGNVPTSFPRPYRTHSCAREWRARAGMPAVRTLDERSADGRCVHPASAVQNVTVSEGEEYGTQEIRNVPVFLTSRFRPSAPVGQDAVPAGLGIENGSKTT